MTLKERNYHNKSIMHKHVSQKDKTGSVFAESEATSQLPRSSDDAVFQSFKKYRFPDICELLPQERVLLLTYTMYQRSYGHHYFLKFCNSLTFLYEVVPSHDIYSISLFMDKVLSLVLSFKDQYLGLSS